MLSLSRLALVVAGRRVVRTLRVSTTWRAEPIPDVVPPPSQSVSKPAPKKRSKPTPSSAPPKVKVKTRTKARTSTKTPLATTTEAKSKPKRARKPKSPSHTNAEGSGFAPEKWRADWGKDATTKRRTKLKSRKGVVAAESNSSKPRHSVPYVRRTEGYISDEVLSRANVLQDIKSPSAHKPIAQLAHGLDRVLFNPTVYWLRDPRSRIYNFTPWLEPIPPVTNFDFDRVTGFIKSSMDDDLWNIAKKHKRPFAGSTSSLTGLLSHCYFLISGDREVDTSTLSRAFLHQPTNFTPGQRMPTSVVLNYKDGVWLIDSDKTQELGEKNVLTWMGTMLEKFLTVPEAEFKKYLRSSPVCEKESDARREAYRYAMSDRFVMRSQLDCVDPRLPGTGVFDIKTRAVVPIRLDILNYEGNSGYLIKTLTGPLESFEKEYYDLIRSAFLKYSFQARIGNMDGVFVAYHNTARIFGFQYVSLEEMEEKLYGSGDGANVFGMCVSLLDRTLTEVVSIYGNRSVKCTFETRESTGQLDVWVQPAEWDERTEGKPCPIALLDVRTTSFIERKEVESAKAVADAGAEGRTWTIQWTLTQSGLNETEIRKRLEGARERQFRALSLPAGVETVEEMERLWAKIDFGKGAGVASGDISKEEAGDAGVGHTDGTQETPPDLDEASPSPSPTPTLVFRQPGKAIQHLRRLALLGRQETLREEAEGREKVVWGSVDRHHAVAERDGDVQVGGTLPGAIDVGEKEVGGVVVVGAGISADVGDGRRGVDVDGGELKESTTPRRPHKQT